MKQGLIEQAKACDLYFSGMIVRKIIIHTRVRLLIIHKLGGIFGVFFAIIHKQVGFVNGFSKNNVVE
jgi:hypothetical protein